MNTGTSNIYRGTVAAILLLLFFSLPTNRALSQWSMQAMPPPDVLNPTPSAWWWGPQIGVNLNTHEGEFFTKFCECSFKDGSGVGITAGVEVGHMLSPGLGIAVKLLYNDLQAQYSNRVIESTQVVDRDDPSKYEFLDIEWERKNDVKLGYFMLHPVLQLYPMHWLYVFAGPAIGIKTTATQSYSKIPDEQFEILVGDPNVRVVTEDSGPIPDAASTRADLRAGLGLNIRLGRSIRIAPEVSYGLPLTTISDDDDWKAQAIHATAVLKFDL